MPSPASASLGWPKVNGGDWEPVRERFEAGLNRALALADAAGGWRSRLRPSIEVEFLASYTAGDA